MSRIPTRLFVELCAGTAALSLAHFAKGDPLKSRKGAYKQVKPPVSRMGSKAGYAEAILDVLGLEPGEGREVGTHYLWCEPDPGCRLLLYAYRKASLSQEAASILRGWAGEDPRALWERLRAEGPPRLPDGGAEAGEVARAVTMGQWSYRRMEPESGWCSVRVPCGEEPIIEGDRKPARNIAADIAGLATLPAEVHPDARAVDPREVARWLQIVASNELINVAWNEAAGRWQNTGKGGTTFGGPVGYGGDRVPGKLDALPGDLPADIAPDARAIEPGPCLPPGTICYMDPPYVGTTQYANHLGRADVVAIARRWAAAGATVCISEAEPIPDLVADGWEVADITGRRKGQRRTFSKQQSEYLTIKRATP